MHNTRRCVDEVKMYYDCRWNSASKASWRIFTFDIHLREPAIERLSFHLPNKHMVMFRETESLIRIVSNKHMVIY